MMKHLLSRALIAFLLTFTLFSVQMPVFAATQGQETRLTLQVGDPRTGQHALAQARLATADGTPLPDMTIQFLVNGQADGEARTDADGNAEWRLRTEFGKGTYTISAIFAGTPELAGAQADTQFRVLSTVLTLDINENLSSSGNHVPLVAQLVDSAGTPVADAAIIFLVDGKRDGESRTDKRGRAEWRLRADLAAGDHKVEALFEADPSRLGSRASTTFSIVKTQIELHKTDSLSRTDPYISFTARLLRSDGTPIAGAQVHFLVDGAKIGTNSTDANGAATRRIKRELQTGGHTVIAVYDGKPFMQAASAEATFTLANTALDIHVAPERSQGGQRTPVLIHLAGPDGAPVADARVEVFVDGERDGQVWTNAQGQAVWRIQRTLAAGNYALSAVFAGRNDLERAEATTPFAVTGTVLTVTSDPAASIQIGQPFAIVAQLKTSDGAPIANGRVSLKVNGIAFNEVRTNADGTARWSLRGAPTAGTYKLEASFAGLPGLLVTQTASQFQVTPAFVAVQTVPPLAGVRFSLGGQEFVSDASGLARLEVSTPGIYHLKLLGGQTSNPMVRVGFARWQDDYFVPERDVRVPMNSDTPLQIGFNVSYQITPSFVDNAGVELDLSRVTAFSLNSSDGKAYDFTNAAPQWLEANHIVRAKDGLEVHKILFSVHSVMVDGSNVVNQGQQRIYADVPQPWQIRVQTYSVRFVVLDGFFGWPIGKDLTLTYPNGQKVKVPLNSNGPTVISGLARGKYDARVSAPGISNPTPFTMARDQEVVIEVLSYLDIALACGLAALLAFGLLLVGRPTVRQAVRHPGMALRGLGAGFGEAVAVVGSLFGKRSPGRMRLREQRVAELRQRSSWPRVRDPMTVAVTVLVGFGLVGLGVAGAEASRRNRGSTSAAPVAAAQPVAGERPQTEAAAPPPVVRQAPPVNQRLLEGAPTPADATEAQAVPVAPITVAVPQAPAPTEVTAAQPTILTYDGTVRYKSRGPKVKALQQRLLELGYFNDQVTGYFGSITQTALANFQRARNLDATGYPNEDTIDALNQCDQSCVQSGG